MRTLAIMALAYIVFAAAFPYLVLVALRRREAECARCRANVERPGVFELCGRHSL